MRGPASVDDQFGAGHVGAVLGCEEVHARGEFGRFGQPADRGLRAHRVDQHLRIAGNALVDPALEAFLEQRGNDKAGVQRIGADRHLLVREFHSDALGEQPHRAFAGVVGGHFRIADQPHEEEATGGEDGNSNALLWLIILGVVVAGLAGFGIYLYDQKMKRDGKKRIYKRFSTGTLKEFADFHDIKIEQLKELNPEFFQRFASLKGKDLENKVAELRKEKHKLVIGPVKTGISNSNSGNQEAENLSSSTQAENQISSNLPAKKEIAPENGGGREIQVTFDTKSLLNSIALKVKELLEAQTIEIEKKVNSEISQNQIANVSAVTEAKKAIIAELATLGEQKENPNANKVVDAEFLISRCGLLLGCLKEIRSIQREAYQIYSKISGENAQAGIAFGQMLLKYNATKPAFDEDWGQCIADIKETGLTASPVIVGLLKRSERYGDLVREKEFRMALHEGGLEKLLSCILVLVEELRSISRFVDSNANLESYQRLYGIHLETLRQKCKALGYEPKYIPLFVDYTKDPTPKKLANVTFPSEPHSKVVGLEKDSVVEVVSYGFKSDLNDSDTLFIKV